MLLSVGAVGIFTKPEEVQASEGLSAAPSPELTDLGSKELESFMSTVEDEDAARYEESIAQQHSLTPLTQESQNLAQRTTDYGLVRDSRHTLSRSASDAARKGAAGRPLKQQKSLAAFFQSSKKQRHESTLAVIPKQLLPLAGSSRTSTPPASAIERTLGSPSFPYFSESNSQALAKADAFGAGATQLLGSSQAGNGLLDSQTETQARSSLAASSQRDVQTGFPSDLPVALENSQPSQIATAAPCEEREGLRQSVAAKDWLRIQHAMKKQVPLCKGHRQPCVFRVVKKGGPNMGRGFYVCARAEVRRGKGVTGFNTARVCEFFLLGYCAVLVRSCSVCMRQGPEPLTS